MVGYCLSGWQVRDCRNSPRYDPLYFCQNECCGRFLGADTLLGRFAQRTADVARGSIEIPLRGRDKSPRTIPQANTPFFLVRPPTAFPCIKSIKRPLTRFAQSRIRPQNSDGKFPAMRNGNAHKVTKGCSNRRPGHYHTVLRSNQLTNEALSRDEAFSQRNVRDC